MGNLNIGHSIAHLSLEKHTTLKGLQQPIFRTRRPIPLRLSSILSFNVLLIVLCITVALLWHFSQISDGFTLQTANRYLLTYGPTALLVFFVAVWRQIDYHVKASAPWEELVRGFSLAPRSILIDYISTFQALALWSAIKYRHFAVLSTSLGFLFLKLATLSSTGLFILEPSIVERSALISTQDSFSAAKFASANENSTFDQSLVYTTYGILAQNLQKPFGLGPGFAYSEFSVSPALDQNLDMTVEVDAFMPSFECQLASMTVGPLSQNTTDAFPETLLQIQSPACSVRAQDVSIYTLNPQTFRCPERQLSGLFRSIDCTPDVFGTENGTYELLVLTDMRYQQQLDLSDTKKKVSDPVEAISWQTEIAQMSALVCRTSYEMGHVTVNVSSRSPSDLPLVRLSSQLSKTPSLKLQNLTDEDLDELVRGSLSASDSILGNRVDNGYSLEYPDPVFKMMASVAAGTYESLLNSSTMATAANTVIQQLSAQIAHQYLRVPIANLVTSNFVSSENHLKITSLSAWIVFGALVSVVALCTAVFILRRRASTGPPHDHLECMTSLLRSNLSIEEQLLTSQAYKESALSETFKDVEVYLSSKPGGAPQVLLSSTVEWPDRPVDQQFWWNPLTVGKAALATTFMLNCAVIAALEVVQRTSDNNHGLIQLPAQESELETVYVKFIPALMLLLIASSFNCLDFNVLLLIPFNRLQNGDSPENYSALPLVSQHTISALWISLKRKYWAALASSSAAVIGSLLTIVVSGLYTIDVVQQSQNITIGVRDEVFPVWAGSVLTDGGAAVLSSLIENLDFPDPKGTFDEIVLPMIDVPQETGLDNTNTTLQTRSSVWRADLNCTTLPKSNYSATTTQSPFQNTIFVNATYGLPVGCSLGGPNGTESSLTFDQAFNFPLGENLVYIGKLLDLHVGPYDPIEGESQGETEPSAMMDNPLGCPSLAFIYGLAGLTNSSTAQQQSVQIDVCYQQIQSLNATMTFHDLDLEVDTSQPPQLDENSVQYIALTSNATSYAAQSMENAQFQFRIQNHMDNEFALFNTSGGNTFSRLSTSSPTLDNFFQGVLFGRSIIPLETLQLQTQEQIDTIKSGILAFYRRYMAQAISLNMRVPLANPQTQELTNVQKGDGLIEGSLSLPTRRLIQHKNSKLVLQGMLGFMLVCGVFAACSVQFHRLLPATMNPCTIWGQLSLLAGSRVVRADAENVDSSLAGVEEQDMHRTSRGGGQLKLGWWDMEGGEKRYGVGGVE